MIPAFVKYLYRRPQHIFIQTASTMFAQRLNISAMQNVMIISPHPDDEVFGCGNLIKKLCEAKKQVTLVFLSKGEGAAQQTSMTSEEVVSARRNLSIQANSILGLSAVNIKWLDFPDAAFAKVDKDEIQKLTNIIDEIAPDTIFYPHPYENSPDHDFASKTVAGIVDKKSAAKYCYCVWLWHHMPFRKALKLNYKKSYLLPVDSCEKMRAVEIYAEAMDAHGNYYSGKLPKMLLKAVNWNNELFFKA